jgi:hypothetical protein
MSDVSAVLDAPRLEVRYVGRYLDPEDQNLKDHSRTGSMAHLLRIFLWMGSAWQGAAWWWCVCKVRVDATNERREERRGRCLRVRWRAQPLMNPVEAAGWLAATVGHLMREWRRDLSGEAWKQLAGSSRQLPDGLPSEALTSEPTQGVYYIKYDCKGLLVSCS